MAEAGIEATATSTEERFLVRNFFGGIWHGAFLALGNALTHPGTVLAGFIAILTGSTVWVGGLTTVLQVANVLPQTLAARYIEPKKYKMPFLLAAIYIRVASWGLLAWLIYVIGKGNPRLLEWVLVVLLAVFYAGGGFGGLPYTDIIGKVIPLNKRGAFFATRAAVGGTLAFSSMALVRYVLKSKPYPTNYAMLFGLAAVSLFIASFGFLIIKEPPRPEGDSPVPPWSEYVAQLKRASKDLADLVAVQMLTSFSLAVIPFYTVYGLKVMHAPVAAVARFGAAMLLGVLLANFAWGWLVDAVGSREMLLAYGIVSVAAPILAILLAPMGWQWLYVPLFLSGAATSGSSVGFSSALLELAPVNLRATYTGVISTLTLPQAAVPLLAGILLKVMSYDQVFLLAAAVTAIGGVWTLRLPKRDR